jgi:hypothetical protein
LLSDGDTNPFDKTAHTRQIPHDAYHPYHLRGPGRDDCAAHRRILIPWDQPGLSQMANHRKPLGPAAALSATKLLLRAWSAYNPWSQSRSGQSVAPVRVFSLRGDLVAGLSVGVGHRQDGLTDRRAIAPAGIVPSGLRQCGYRRPLWIGKSPPAAKYSAALSA